jgi:hypothetical protein
MPDGVPKKVNFHGDDGQQRHAPRNAVKFGVSRKMSYQIEPQDSSAAMRGVSTDVKILAHIEQWIAMIRDISRETLLSREPLKS